MRHCVLERALFEAKFVHVGEGLPPARYPGDLGLEDDRDGASFHHEGLVDLGDKRDKG